MYKAINTLKLITVNTSIAGVFFIIYWKALGSVKYDLLGKREVVDELLDIKDFKYLINPEKTCSFCKHDYFQIIIVLSATTNFEKRATVRKNLKRSTNCIKTVFLLGSTDKTNVTQAINEESRQFGDILQGDVVDTYRNLTYKHLMGLKWVMQFCTPSRHSYIIKIDDDYKLLIDIYYKMLAQDFWGKSRILCEVEKNKGVYRDVYYKWAVGVDEYREDIYPTYCNGNSLIIYPTAVAQLLLEESRKVPFFWIDDIFITGILAKRLGIRHYELHETRHLTPRRRRRRRTVQTNN